MRVYHERLSVPLGWWLLGLVTILLLATELAAGYSWPVVIGVYAVLTAGLALMLLNWGRPTVEVGGGELRAGWARLQLAAVGEVSALDEAQTRSLRGPRGDPAAFLVIRPYLRRAVYVEVARPGAENKRGHRRLLWRGFRTRHPAELAAAIEGARPAARAGDATMG
jgi:Protein of unknown function (DUF3093)